MAGKIFFSNGYITGDEFAVEDKKVGALRYWGGLILESLAGIVAIISLTQNYIVTHAEHEVNLSYVNETEDRLVYENDKMLPDAFLLTQGQIVIKSVDNTMIKTFIIDGMYEPSMRIEDNKRFLIKSMECPLADLWIEKLHTEVMEQLIMSGDVLQDEIVIEKIGLVCINIWSKDQDKWIPFYYILEGNILTKLDEKTAIEKMNGVKITEELSKEKSAALVKRIIKETLEEVKYWKNKIQE